MTSSAPAQAAPALSPPQAALQARRAVRKPQAARRRHARTLSGGGAGGVFALADEAVERADGRELGAKRSGRAPVRMGDVMSAVTRDLRITGVTKRGSSWQYHIEALDIRANGSTLLPPALAAGTPPSTPPSTPPADAAGRLEASASQTSGAGFYPDLPPMVRYTVLRRYNDFRQLYVYLVDTFGAGVRDLLPEFPDNGWLSFIRGDDPKLLQFRREHLQAFLRAVDAHDVLKWCDAFTHFLRPDVREMASIGGSLKQTLEQTSEQDEAMVSLNNLSVGRVNSTGGYVSLSYLKSPEIRFSHQQPPRSAPVLRSDARGDSKRRRVALANLYDDPSRSKRKPSAAASGGKSMDSALNTGSTTASGESVDSDSDEDDADSSFGSRSAVSLRQQTELLRLLSLDPPANARK